MQNKRMVMIPGPTPVVRSIQNQMGREVAAFGDPEFINDYKVLISELKELWHCTGEVFVVAGTGTLAMEMAVANSVKAGDNVLLVSHGFFGDRFVEIFERKGIVLDVLKSEWGKIVPVSEIEKKLSEKAYKAVFVTHVDTSTGVCAPIAEIGKVVKKYEDTLFVVDGVCATAAEPEYINDMSIDILFTGSQKAFGVCPGLLILWASEKAMARRKSLGQIIEYYCDFDKWLPIMHDPSKYFATPAINLVWALLESVRIIKAEGLENRYARHIKIARAVQAALLAMGFKLLAEDGYRSVALSNIIYPDGIDDVSFRKAMYSEGVVVAGGLGAYAGKMFRMGHMGNIDLHDVTAVISAIERVLGDRVKPGTAVSAFMEQYNKA